MSFFIFLLFFDITVVTQTIVFFQILAGHLESSVGCLSPKRSAKSLGYGISNQSMEPSGSQQYFTNESISCNSMLANFHIFATKYAQAMCFRKEEANGGKSERSIIFPFFLQCFENSLLRKLSTEVLCLSPYLLHKSFCGSI